MYDNKKRDYSSLNEIYIKNNPTQIKSIKQM